MVKLTEKQANLFLDKNFGAVATIRPDGTPHVTPVWVDYDGERPLFNTATGRAEMEALAAGPRGSRSRSTPRRIRTTTSR